MHDVNEYHVGSSVKSPSRWSRYVIWIMAIAILIPSLWGFGYKFFEFLALYRSSPDGAFAVAPVVNYLAASAGFFLLLLWATYNGMFRNVESPKYWMLENENRLDGVQQPCNVRDK
jgi:hypothetical protein